MKKSFFGYFLRKPIADEIAWFKSNENIAGYASLDGFIVINPYSKLSALEIQSVCRNEAIRLFLRNANIVPRIKLTEKQINFFLKTPYQDNPVEMKKTIIARIIANDPSAQDYTKKQKSVADTILKMAQQNEK